MRIYIISPEAWGPYQLSKHHYAKTLSRSGHQVYFINPPSKETTLVFIQEGLYVLNYRNLMRGMNILPKFANKLLLKWLCKRINSLCNGKPDLVWSFDPFRFQDLRLFNSNAQTIYFAADIHRFKGEQDLADSSDLVLGPSDFCIEKIKHPNKKVIDHGLPQHFLNQVHLNNSQNSKIKVGYVGNLIMKFIDHALLFETIQSFPDVSFVLVGPANASTLSGNRAPDKKIKEYISKIIAMPNVRHIDKIPNNQMPQFLSEMDVLLLCYDHEKWFKESSNSHKIMEFLSSGKPVLSLPIYHYRASNLLIQVEKKDYLNMLKTILSDLPTYESPSLVEQRKAFASAHTYENNLKKVFRYLNEVK